MANELGPKGGQVDYREAAAQSLFKQVLKMNKQLEEMFTEADKIAPSGFLILDENWIYERTLALLVKQGADVKGVGQLLWKIRDKRTRWYGR